MAYYFNRSLFLRISFFILLGASAVLLLVISINHIRMKETLLTQEKAYYNTLAENATQEIQTYFVEATQRVSLLKARLERGLESRENVTEALVETMRNSKTVLGMAVALTPEFKSNQESDYQILYCWKTGFMLDVDERENPEQDYQSDWYYVPYYLHQAIWTDPYYDHDTHEMMVTYAEPLIERGKVIAIMTCDLSLYSMKTFLGRLDLGKNGDAMLASRFGKIIVHSNTNWVMRETIYSLGESASDPEEKENYFKISHLLTTQQDGSLRFERRQKEDFAWLYFQTIPATEWRVGFVVPEHQILQPIYKMSRDMVLLSLGGVILLLIPAFLVSLTITRPLKELCVASDKLASGDFDTQLPEAKHPDEIGRLVNDFERMRFKLKDYIKHLAHTTAEKEKIASELSIARDIQHSILPKLFPPFPKKSGLDIFAILESAKEVGGDLYDFLLLDEDHLYICIGDVSGKGVPASLFMAVGKTLLKSTIQTIPDPAKALYHVNNELSEGNEASMFITLFCGILDLRTNVLTYANAGHNPPLLIQKDRIDYFEFASSPPLAAMEDIEFKNEKITLEVGSKILLYTDGVTEAMNGKQELYGEDRLLEFCKQSNCRTSEKSIQTLMRDIKTFVNGTEQSDDITMLCFSYTDPKESSEQSTSPTSSLALTNHHAEIARMVTWLEEMAKALQWSQELLGQLNLVLEEWLVNVVSYAFPDKGLHEIELRLWQDEHRIHLEIIDDGIPFNPLKREEPDLDLPIEERGIGGLGIHFIKNTMDEFHYERKDNTNVISMVKKL